MYLLAHCNDVIIDSHEQIARRRHLADAIERRIDARVRDHRAIGDRTSCDRDGSVESAAEIGDGRRVVEELAYIGAIEIESCALCRNSEKNASETRRAKRNSRNSTRLRRRATAAV